MGFISRLKELLGGSKKTIPAAIPPVSPTTQPKGGRTARNAVVRNDWLTLTQPDFFGQAHRSPNKRWIVGCNDSDGVGRGGHREAEGNPDGLRSQRRSDADRSAGSRRSTGPGEGCKGIGLTAEIGKLLVAE